MLVDSHCHLNRLPSALAGDLPPVLEEARVAGVAAMLCVGVEADTLGDVVALARQYTQVWAAVGIHPCEANSMASLPHQALDLYLQDPRVVAVGETGLDFYHQEGCHEARQYESFYQQIMLAKSHKKPLIIHTRASAQETLAFLRTHAKADVVGVFHCFTESYEVAKQVLDLGFMVSLSGILTFKNAQDCRDMAKKLPRDRVLVETDSPYLAPVPYRGKVNQPAYVREVARCLADVWGMDYEQVCAQTGANFQQLFPVGAL